MTGNPRFRAWCRTTGRVPERGEPLHEYIIWISQRWREFDAEHDLSGDRSRTEAEHEAFDLWLQAVAA